jgi:hypothetical protein
MRCFIYRNLHKDGYTYSLRAVEGVYKGRVIGYSTFLWVDNASFVVSEAGRQRVLATQRKNVHAGIVGDVGYLFNYEPRLIVDVGMTEMERPLDQLVEIGYNPYKYDSFVAKMTEAPIKSASHVLISGGLIEACGLT